MLDRRCFQFVVLVACVVSPPRAQVTSPGEPLSATFHLTTQVPTVTLPRVDTAALRASDRAAGKSGHLRFGAEIPLQTGIGSGGVWETLANGARVWRLRVQSTQAYSLSLMFDRFRLQPGNQLFVYDDARRAVRGAYTAANNKADLLFAIEPVAGDAITLELVVPAGSQPGLLQLSTVVHDYINVIPMMTAWGHGTSKMACETDVNCPVGLPWQNQIRATVQLQVGGGLCTGSLLNNTAVDGKQLFITANHCGNLNNAIFRFKYQRSGCGTGTAPRSMTVQGSRQLAANSGIDFRLVEITGNIPASYDAYYAGWDRSGTFPSNSVTVHHPQGGTKKISFDNDPPGKSGTDWRIFQWDLGVTEPGSSGCPLYDPKGRFIGQLWGGAAACGFPYNDYYGRLDAAWSRVAPYLDPTGSGVAFLNGFDPNGTAGPPVVTSISPTTAEAFLPGLVTVNGSALLNTTQVLVGTQPAAFTPQSDTQLTFTPPNPAAFGAVPVTVTNSFGTSMPQTLIYLPTNPPKHSVPGVYDAGGAPLPLAWAGLPGDSYVVGITASPTTTPFNGFSTLQTLTPIWQGTLDALGYGPAGIAAPVPAAAAGATFYSQAWTIDLAGGTTSFKASTAMTTTLR